MDTIYPHLPTYWSRLQLNQGANILVPLCGKSLDLLWLKNKKYTVIGVEVSEKAAKDFFHKNELSFEKSTNASFTIYQSGNLAIWAGDFFKLKKGNLPDINAVYDKAALIALPLEKRKRYAEKLLSFCHPATQILMNTFEYEQEEMNGPPFAVSFDEVKKLFGKHFTVDLLHQESIIDDLPKFQQRGLSSYLIEKIYHLYPSD